MGFAETNAAGKKCKTEIAGAGFLRLETDEEAARAIRAARRAKARSRIQKQNAVWTGAAIVALGVLGAGTLRSEIGQMQSRGNIPLAATTTITVKTGDTLWGVAKAVAGPGDNLPDRIEEIAQSNGIKSSKTLIPGMHLVVTIRNPQMLAQLHNHQPLRLAARN